MATLFEQLSSWHWVSVGILLLIAEAMGAGGFLLGSAVSALLLGALLYLVPELHWHQQLVIFAVASTALSFCYWKYFRKFNEQTEEPLLNNRVAQMVGKKFTLETPIVNGSGKVQLNDTFWTISAEVDIPAQTSVEVVGYLDMTLVVKSTNSSKP